VVTGKLDYALSRCRHEYGYRRRLREGLHALAEVPLRMLTLRNLRSAVVWLLWPRPSGPAAAPGSGAPRSPGPVGASRE
jgi:hypothetical protein